MDQPERVRYFDQQFLRVDDFTAEQDYHRDMRRRHNRMLHTPGIADGLLLVADGTGVKITPGAAIPAGTDVNGGGAEIVLGEERRQELSSFAGGADVYVTIAFDQEKAREKDDAGVKDFTRWRENPVIEALPSDPTATPPSPTQPQRVLLGRVTRGGASGKDVLTIDGSGRRLAGSAESELSLTPRDPQVQEPDWVRLRWKARGQAEMRGSLTIQPGGPTAGDLSVAGAVGVGTSLTVGGAAKARSLRIDTTAADPPISDLKAGGLSFHFPGTATAADVRVANDAAGRLTLQAAVTSVSGRLGIGTTAPAQDLHVTGNGLFNNVFAGDIGYSPAWAAVAHRDTVGTANSYALLQSNDGRNTFLNKRSGSGAIEFRVDNVTKLSINDAGELSSVAGLGLNGNAIVGGRIGVGTTTPGHSVHSTGNGLFNNAFLGDVGHSAPWAGIAHRDAIGTLSYALMHSSDGKNTFLNKRSGGGQIELRVDNQPKLAMDDGGTLFMNGKNAIQSADPWLRLNQTGAFASGVHTPGLLAPGSLNVGGAGGYGNPGGGNAWVTGSVAIGTTAFPARLTVAGGDIQIDGGSTLRSTGRLHVSSEEDIYLLAKGGHTSKSCARNWRQGRHGCWSSTANAHASATPFCASRARSWRWRS